ncbi:MAG TPA: hypothetical protein VFK80_00575, partial [Limnochordia bacterium]|nr:hypothetical protein [Limnochordia bacterium]
PMAASSLVPHEADVVSGMSLTLLATFWVGLLWDWVWELLDNLFLALLAGGPNSVLTNTYGLRVWLHKMLGFPWEHIAQVTLDDQGAAEITIRSGDAKRVRSEIERLDFVRAARINAPGGRPFGA